MRYEAAVTSAGWWAVVALAIANRDTSAPAWFVVLASAFLIASAAVTTWAAVAVWRRETRPRTFMFTDAGKLYTFRSKP